MSQPWHQNKGYKFEGNETKLSYDRFIEFVRMGPRRRVNTLATKINVDRQTLYKLAGKFNWIKRAKAYDAHVKKMGDQVEHLPDTPTVEAIPDSNGYSNTIKVFQESEHSRLSHEEKVLLYQRTFETLGAKMTGEAVASIDLACRTRETIEKQFEKYQKLIDLDDVAKSEKMSRRIESLINRYMNLCKTTVDLSTAGRQIYGDALGVNQMLQQFYRLQTVTDAQGTGNN